jgi:regulation of enolase protein 1 (concanavalin A-like superfamily)
VDSGHFVYQTLFGDGEIIARVDQLQNTGTSSRVGVMIRNTLASNAQYAAMTATGTGAYRWSRRTVAGAKSTVTNHGNGTLPNVWVRLTRVGNTFTSFTSTNGTTWTNVGAVTMSLPSNCLIGLYVASGSNTTLNTSRFVNVTVAP